MKKKMAMVLCLICLITAGCSRPSLGIGFCGNTVIIENIENSERLVFSEEKEVFALQNIFSGSYEQIKSYDKGGETYIVYFGDDLDQELAGRDDYSEVYIKDDNAYVTDENGVFYVSEDVDLSLFDAFVR